MLYLKYSPLRSAILLNDSKLYNIYCSSFMQVKAKDWHTVWNKKKSTDCV